LDLCNFANKFELKNAKIEILKWSLRYVKK